MAAVSKGSSNQRPDVSFVVIAFNEEANIERCLTSIAAQDGAGALEIVVVDDCSTDATATVVESFAFAHPTCGVRLVRHPVNRGRGAARHSGLAAARGRRVAMVDADIVLSSNWLDRCARAMEEQQLAAVGGIAVPDGDVTYINNTFRLRPRPIPPTVPVSGSNGLYERVVFDQVAMDPMLAEGEDVAFNRAMEAAGLRTATAVDVIVEHHEAKGLIQSTRWLFQSGQGATRQYIRYREVRTPDLALLGQIGTVLVAVVARATGRSRTVAWSLPLAYLVTASAAHLRGKFDHRGAGARFALATVVNSVFLGAYFAGRLVGLPRALREGPPDPGNR